MGDCTIHLLIENVLVSSNSSSDKINSNDQQFDLDGRFETLRWFFSADASLVELISIISQALNNGNGRQNDLSSLCIIDASYHPPKNITPIIRSYPESSGPRSKTLQSMGWFPSGKLVILSSVQDASSSSAVNETERAKREQELLTKFVEWQSRHVLRDEEFGYNLPTSSASSKNEQTVQYIGAGSTSTNAQLKPTEIFNAVQQRFKNEALPIQQPATTQTKRRQRTEKQRHQRLDSILNNLHGKKKTSQQVRSMLIKSRSVGDKKLRMEDRFHLEVVRFDDTSGEQEQGKSDYCFFSRQTTAGRVASGVAPSLGEDRAAEFLVSLNNASESEKRYRRLPNTMSLHDAQRAGYLNEFDVVLIRIYSVDNACADDEAVGPSKSVLDPESDDESPTDTSNRETMEVQPDTKESTCSESPSPEESTSDLGKAPNTQYNLMQRIQSVFQLVESGEVDGKGSNSKPVKKKKATSKQVQNMLMKSKSTGNARIKQDDRVYLEVIAFQDNNSEITASCISSHYKFFERRDDVGRIIASMTDAIYEGKASDVEVELIVQVPNSNTMIQRLPATMTLGDAMQKKLMETFDRVLLRIFEHQAGIFPCE
jgi:hypothetical protein